METSELFTRIIENMSDSFLYGYSPQKHITCASHSVEKVLGYTIDEFQTSIATFLTPHPVNKSAEKHMDLSIQGIQQPSYELQIKHKNGSICWIAFSDVPVLDEQGIVISIEGIAHDITLRKQAETEKERLTAIFDQTPDLVSTYLPDGRITLMNRAGKKLLGWLENSEPLNQKIPDVHPKWAAQLIEEKGIPSAIKNSVWKGETALLSREGREIPVSQVIMAHTNYKNELVFLSTIMRDISELKKSEKKLLSVQKELQNNEALLKSIFRAAPVGIGIVTDRVFGWTNTMIHQMTGYSAEELEGQSARMLYPTEEDFDHVGQEKYYQITRFGTGSVETHWKRKNGQIIDVLLSSTPTDPDDLKQGVVFSALDISEKKTAEKDRINLKTQLHQVQKMEAIGTLAGGIAHDFNNILSSIFGFTELIMVEISKESQSYNKLQQVMKAAERAKDLVEQILTFSRKTDQIIKPVQVKLVIKEVLKLLRATLPTTINIDQNIASNSLVMCDPTQIHQVLINLCTNAKHAMREKGGTLTVELKDVVFDSAVAVPHPDMKAGGYIDLKVADTGQGMYPDVMSRIFDPFFTTKEMGEGTGMGLSVVHGIIKSFDGAITVHSLPGKGATFHVFLPSIEMNIPNPVESEEPIPTGSERILFVDDEEMLAQLGKQLLEAIGYNVTVKTGSMEALALFRKDPHAFDLVITDMTMPDMKGDDLSRELIAIRPDIPIILCTGFRADIKTDNFSKTGVRAVVEKPFSRRELSKTIRRLIEDTQ